MKRLLLLPALLAATLAHTQAETPLDTLPYTPSLDVTAMDRSADPCDDLYRYACGAWTKTNPIPADQSRWSVYAKMANENQRYLWGVLNKLGDASPERTPAQTKLGDYFATCMDEGAVQAAGLKPLQPLLDRIAALGHKRDLPALLAELQLAAGGERFFFDFSAGQDFADATRQIAFATAGGLGLPDRDYYLKRDAKTLKIRAAYEAHVARMFELLGEPPAAARAAARSVLATETVLARASLSKVDKRDPYKTFHVVDAAGLKALTPGFDWPSYQAALGTTPWHARYNVTEPAFFKAFAARLKAMSLVDLKTYLRWQLASSLSPALDNAFVQANFDFYGQTLTGTPQLKPRWKRCVQLVDLQLGEALGQEFVARNFTPDLKDATVQMTVEIQAAMARSIDSLTWMSAETKARAHAKLKTIVNKVGYPERWRDYTVLAVQRGDFLGNVMRGNAFEHRRQLAKIGQPLDRGEWHMTPQTVNAYYDAQMNDINFPAGVLQPPLYDPRMDEAPNYGNTGGTIGHELTHGFDDEGRQFDAQGNLKSWWTKKDNQAFEKRAACVADQYAQYPVIDDIKINSKLTLGEDLADLGGLVLAWEAWKAHMKGRTLESRDGMTPEQRFFVGFAQWDCADARPEQLRVQAKVDPHSPAKWRINGVVVNMPEFEKAFNCKPGAKLVKPAGQHCKVW
ncbi:MULTISPECIES: M13 family metallopeptidase [unclassified Roseateles]|uniref:M13 family metallopeptidase n=1 Tax=unclassified Roseateles TaxID=2626991 RepID=UPI0006F21019|nr:MULTISPECIES: M13 family metallopeptidase [unclassified Roseateles]KQW46404.1 peptidase M13 [Pelomonas sp. Root405]KRA73454.1 peptidase M13 [Pelomonas sp. Root662]